MVDVLHNVGLGRFIDLALAQHWLAAGARLAFVLGVAGQNAGTVRRLDVPVRRDVVDSELHKGAIGRELVAIPQRDFRHAFQRRERDPQHPAGRADARQTFRVDRKIGRLLVEPYAIEGLALQGHRPGLIGAKAQRRDSAARVAHLNRVVGVGLTAGQYRITNKSILRDHARPLGLDVARLAAQFFLADIAHHLERIADRPGANRLIEFPARPVRRVFAGRWQAIS